jgi:signal transduction histidine kinase
MLPGGDVTAGSPCQTDRTMSRAARPPRAGAAAQPTSAARRWAGPLTPVQSFWWWSAAAALAIVIFSVSVPVDATVYRVPVLAAFAVGLLQCGSILLSMVAPRWATASWIAGASVFFLFSEPASGAPWPVDVGGLLSLCALLLSLGLRRPVLEGVTAWALAVAASVVVLIFVSVGASRVPAVGGVVANLVTTTAITATVLLLAVLAAQRGRMRGELAAEHQRRVLVEERNRIARELHDVVAHSMSVIQVQAASAPYRLPDLDEASRSEFADIAASARSAMREMRQLLGVLRSEGAGADGTPQPGIGQIPDLVPSLTRAGVHVTVDLSPALPPDGLISLAAYRIVQESLSNVVRHAPGAAVRVRGELIDGAITLAIENDPPTTVPVSHSGGHGLIGMRERCEMFGGTLSAHPTDEGGYRVLAVLPLPASAPPVAPAAPTDKDPIRP